MTDGFEIYLLLFTDSFFSNLSININKELIIYTIKAFIAADNLLVIICATFANIFACIVNYCIGKILFYAINTCSNKNTANGLNQKLHAIAEYKIQLLILSAVPFFGKFIIVVAGFVKIPLRITIYIVAILKFCYYSYTVLVR